MTTFQRKLGIDKYSAEQIAAAPWLAEMLRHWRPAGHAVPMQYWEPPLVTAGGAPIPKKPKMMAGPRPFGLRLAIRDGYANFYCGGQSIAEVRAGRGLSAKIHKKYTTDVQVVGQEYVHLSDVEPQIEAWMTRMHRHQGLEKLLVDELCAANGGLIDMEAGLPGLRLPSPTTGIPRAVALRLDLVVLEPCDDGWTAALWEAKLPKNSSVSTTSDVPAVLAQLGNYADWFRLPGATEAILAGYRETCVQMVALHDRAGEIGIQLLPLHESITAIAADPSRLKAVDPKLRLVIDIRHMGKGFETDHVPRLRAAGIQVHLVRTNDDLVLPAGRAT